MLASLAKMSLSHLFFKHTLHNKLQGHVLVMSLKKSNKKSKKKRVINFLTPLLRFSVEFPVFFLRGIFLSSFSTINLFGFSLEGRKQMYMLVKVRFPAFGDGSLSLTIDWWKKKKSQGSAIAWRCCAVFHS